MIVCVCNNVSDREIAREAASGCPSFGQLQMRTGVAAGCGACHECAREVFAAAHRSCAGRVLASVPVGESAGLPSGAVAA